jgi:hypothetical protein
MFQEREDHHGEIEEFCWRRGLLDMADASFERIGGASDRIWRVSLRLSDYRILVQARKRLAIDKVIDPSSPCQLTLLALSCIVA